MGRGSKKPFDEMRARLLERIRERGTTMRELSLGMDHSHSYLQQFIYRGTPEKLSEEDRAYIARRLDMPETELMNRPKKKRYSAGVGGSLNAPFNKELCEALVRRLLLPLLRHEDFAEKVARSVLRAYEAGIATGVDPNDQVGIDRLVRLEADRLHDEAHQLKVVK